MEETMGGRVRRLVDERFPGTPQREIANNVGMTPDAFSRALNGHRSFSSLELVRIADLLEADLHWIITGQPDPARIALAARHDFDPATGRRSNAGRDGDAAELRNVELAYRQAFPRTTEEPVPLPRGLEEIRRVLGPDFVRPFTDRLEQNLGVDVVRISGLSTAYSFTIGTRNVVVVPGTGNWFWENWSIAHELGHLAAGHHANGEPKQTLDRHEAEANAFAAAMLLPEDALRAQDWTDVDATELARRIWDLGVSTTALSARLSALAISAAPLITEWAPQPTQRLLRRHWIGARGEPDPITLRMEEAAARRFPTALVEAHVKHIAAGDLGAGTLSWMLGVDPEELEVDVPAVPARPSPDDLATALGL